MTVMADPYKNFENGLNPINDNPIGKRLDLKLTTTDGVIKQLAEDFLFSRNILDGITLFKGQVYRVERSDLTFSDPTIHINTLKGISPDSFLIVKVRIPEIHSHLPIPSSFSENAVDSKIIDLYPYVILDQSQNHFAIGVGDIVEITFANLSDFSDGKIVNKIGVVSNGQGSIVPVGATQNSVQTKNAFDEKLATKDSEGRDAPVTNENVAQEDSGEDAYRDGKKIGRIKVKTAQNTPLKKTASYLAEAFLKMKEHAKRDGIVLQANDGFRTMAEQSAIYNERFTNGVLNEVGKKKGTAAKPGYSKHQNGIAIDIATGGFTTATYAWLDRNAATYGFVNTGKRFSPQEPWHWEFKNSDPTTTYENDARSTKDVNDAKV